MCDESTDACFDCTPSSGPPTRNAIRLDGRDDHVRVGSAAALEVTDYFTVEAWILPQHDTYGVIAGKELEYLLARFPDGKIYFAVYNNAPGWVWVATPVVAPLNQWTHIAWTFNYPTTQKIQFYKNGVLAHSLIGAGPVRNTAPPNDEFRVGGRLAGANYFAGVIDDVRIWNVERTAPQIQQNYNVTLSGVPAGLKGHWRFEEGAGSTTADLASGNTATLTGAAWTINGCDDTRFCNGVETCGGNRLCQNGNPQCPGLICNETQRSCLECAPSGPHTTHGLRFDGRDDYVQAGSTVSLGGSAALTLDAWIFPTGPGANGNGMIVAKEGEYILARYSDGRILYGLSNSQGLVWRYSTAVAPLNAWSHVAVTYDGAQGKVYLNGILTYTAAESGPVSLALAPNNELRIGHRQLGSAPGPYFQGLIDNVRVWNAALSAQAITNLATNGPDDTSLSGNLKARWAFDEGSGTTTVNTVTNAAAAIQGALWVRAGCKDAIDCTEDICGSSQTCLNTPRNERCDDGVACTRDVCDLFADEPCSHVPEASWCDDTVGCNGAESCDAVMGCLPGEPGCDDGLICTTDSCDTGTDSCLHVPNDAQCDDGIPCTIDVCDDFGDELCAHRADHSLCSDGVFCNGIEICDLEAGCKASIHPCTYGCDEINQICEYDPSTQSFLTAYWAALWNFPFNATCKMSAEPTLSTDRWTVSANCNGLSIGDGLLSEAQLTHWLQIPGSVLLHGGVQIQTAAGILATSALTETAFFGYISTHQSLADLSTHELHPSSSPPSFSQINSGLGCGTLPDNYNCQQPGLNGCCVDETWPSPIEWNVPSSPVVVCGVTSDPCDIVSCQCLESAINSGAGESNWGCLSSIAQVLLGCFKIKDVGDLAGCMLDVIDAFGCVQIWENPLEEPWWPVFTRCLEAEYLPCRCQHDFTYCQQYNWIHYSVAGLQSGDETVVRAFCKAATAEGEVTQTASATVTDSLHSGCLLCRCPHGTEYHVEIDDPTGPGEPKRCAVKDGEPPSHLVQQYTGVLAQDFTAEFECGCIPPDSEFGELVECSKKFTLFLSDGLCPGETVEIHANVTHDSGGINNHSHAFTNNHEEFVFHQLYLQTGDMLQVNIESPQGPDGAVHSDRECVFVGGAGNQSPNLTIDNIDGEMYQSVVCREKTPGSAPTCTGTKIRVHLSGPQFTGRIHMIMSANSYHADLDGFIGQTLESAPLSSGLEVSLNGFAQYNSNVQCCFYGNDPSSINCNTTNVVLGTVDEELNFHCTCKEGTPGDPNLCYPKPTDPKDTEDHLLDPWPPRNIPCTMTFPCSTPCSDGMWTWDCPPGGGGGEAITRKPCHPEACPPGAIPGCDLGDNVVECCCDEITVVGKPCTFICSDGPVIGPGYSPSTTFTLTTPHLGVPQSNQLIVNNSLRIRGSASDPDKIAGFLIYLDDQQNPIHSVGMNSAVTPASLQEIDIVTSQLGQGPHALHVVTLDARSGNEIPSLSTIPFTVDHATPAPCSLDAGPPSVSITQPASGAVQPGSVQILANATDDREVKRVEFYLGETMIRNDKDFPFKANWNAAPGSYALTAKAYDGCNPGVTSAVVAVTVAEGASCGLDTMGPTISITTPMTGSKFPGGPIDVVAHAGDASGVDHVNFFFDDLYGSTAVADPLADDTFEATRWYSNPGTFKIHAEAFDECGNSSTSPPIYVHILEGGAPCDYDGAPPTGMIIFPSAGASVIHGSITISAAVNDDLGVFAVVFEIDGTVPPDAVDLHPPYQYTFVAATGTHVARIHVMDLCDNDAWSPALTFFATNRRPVAVVDSVATHRNQSVLISVTSNDYDPDGDIVYVSENDPFPGPGPEHGTVQRIDNNSVRYTPATGFTGDDFFYYRIVDGHGEADKVKAWVKVKP